MEPKANGTAGTGVSAPDPVAAEIAEVIPPSPNNGNHTRTRRARKESTDLVLRQGTEALEEWRFMPVMTVEKALERRQAIVRATNELMKEGVDYGKIPGSDKPALLQPGADKLCNLFGLVMKYEPTKCEEDWTGDGHDGVPFFFYEMKGRAYRQIGDAEYLMGEGMGSCNSWESKYKYRRAERLCPQCGQANIRKSRDGGWFCWLKTDGCGATFAAGDARVENQEVGRRINPDMADIVNTILKMAVKRAKVAATINATSASEFFTQDPPDVGDADPHGFTVDIGTRRYGSQEAANYVAERKLQAAAGPNKPPNKPPVATATARPATPKPWANRGEMRRAFATLRDIVGETAYYTELQAAGVRDPGEFRTAEKAEATYAGLMAIADKQGV